MKKVVVMSDNHRDYEVINTVRQLESDADYYVHCGDSEALDKSYLEGWIAVCGNNDWGIDLEDEIILQVEDVRFYICHGHRLGYFDRQGFMVQLLEDHNCQVILSGHTHVPECTEMGPYYSINPGSTTLPRRGSKHGYCVITVDKTEIKIDFKELKK